LKRKLSPFNRVILAIILCFLVFPIPVKADPRVIEWFSEFILEIVFAIIAFVAFIVFLSKVSEKVKLCDWTKLLVVGWIFYTLAITIIPKPQQDSEKEYEKTSGIVVITPETAEEPEPIPELKTRPKSAELGQLFYLPITWLLATLILIIIIILDYRRLDKTIITPPNHT